MEDRGAALTCLQLSCGLSMQPSEVQHHLQEIRANLEKAVDLMERERPGGSDTTQDILHLFVCFVFLGGLFSFFVLVVFCVSSQCGSSLLPPEEALKLLRRTQRHPGLIMAETQPLHGELEDATARAYAAMGEH